MPQAAREGIVVKVVYNGAIPAPITAGTPIARLVITAPDFPTQEHILVAGADVGEAGIFGRVVTALQYVVLGY
jgi:D-alanyl-D-alanine carboxypeptidase (penicillin-binding protein 5/6)